MTKPILLTTALTFWLTLGVSAQAQAPKADKLDVDAPRVVRTIPIAPHTFEGRWFGPPPASERWLSNQPPPSDRFEPVSYRPAEAENQSSPPLRGSVTPLPKVRPQHAVWRSTDDICAQHNKRKVWQGKSWRCR
jgi:hypothetical protein